MSGDVQQEPSSNDFKLIEEAVRRMNRSSWTDALPQDTLRTVLTNEYKLGRRDLFSLIRAARRTLVGQ